jgi:predicted O-linked N-acetylglucosamine transferase (SPINDLY family)
MSNAIELILLKARNAEKRGEHAEAAALYEAILQRFPGNARARKSLDALLRAQAEAAGTVPRTELDPLLVLYREGRIEAAIEQATELARRYPQALVLHNLIGVSNLRLQRQAEAAAAFRSAIAIKPDFAEAHNNLGIALKNLGEHEAAVASYRQAIECKPDYADAHNNLGVTLKILGRPAEAVACYERALEIKPDYADAHNNMGNMLKDMGRRDEAIASFERALAIRPDYADANNNLGNLYREMGRLDEAISRYEWAIAARPDYAAARAQKMHQQAHICDWDGVAAEAGFLAELGIKGGVVPPFIMMTLDDDPGRNRIRAERFCADQYCYGPLPAFGPAQPRGEKLRIGYFSADFHNHATMYLMARLFEVHDRDRFEIHVFSYGPPREDGMRQRLRRAVDRFHDVREMDDREVAELARREGIDIAVDLKGYTIDSRFGIFAWKAAPIQISYLGYPGTSGAPFIDYVVADKVVIPEEQRRHYSEKVIYLPGSYQVNDDQRHIASMMMLRSEQRLPDQGFVFACFNNSYKITAAEFDIWMRLLGKVEGSVLWLFRANRWAEANLRKEAARRGIDSDRLIFADGMPQAEHLARLKLADLFLDTFLYNAHTTASDALWAGLPVLTRTGQGFATRVAASLLEAVGLPELVTATSDDYERLALELATDRERLRTIRTRLAGKLPSAPLFRTERFARQLEAAYDRVHDDRQQGRPAADMWIQS